jgi:hypothetical protein
MDQILEWRDVGALQHIVLRLGVNRCHDIGVVIVVVAVVVVGPLDGWKR